MPRRVRRNFGVARQRSATNWSRDCDTGSILIAAAQKAFVIVGILENPGISETIRRTRGILAISSDQAAAVEEQVGAFGAMVVNDVAIGVGATAIPGPCTEQDDDGWFVWLPFAQRSIATANSNIQTVEYLFDSKAMRKVEQGFGIAFMVENSSATFGLRANLTVSLLTSRR